VFAISGAMAAVNRRLDVFGVLVLSFVAGTFGGIARDLLIGAVPPAALVDERYLLVSVLAGLIVFFWYAGVDRLRTPMLLFRRRGRRRARRSSWRLGAGRRALCFGLRFMASTRGWRSRVCQRGVAPRHNRPRNSGTEQADEILFNTGSIDSAIPGS
jgi:hypothetical protein